MQLEELQQQWQRLEQKLDLSLALETELVRQVVIQPARQRVNRLALWPAIDLVCCIGVLLFGVAFLRDHWRDWRLVAPASVVLISASALWASCMCQLQLVAELDWSGPVAEIQRSLERLRVAKIRQFKWIILLSPLVGLCGLLVGLHWLFEWLTADRVNVLDKLEPKWIVANYAFGVLFVPVGYFIAWVLAQKCHRHRWWQAVLDDISGNSLNDAASHFERWESVLHEAARHNDSDEQT